MNRAPPSFKVLNDSLRRTTERLAREIAEPSATPPDWTPFDWGVARAAAAMQGIAALLATTLRWTGPVSWQNFLAEQLDESTRRYERIGEILARIDATARRHQVAVVALKGAALREFNLQRVPGERPMGDVDLLIRVADMERLAQALKSIGYEQSYTSRRHQVFRAVHARVTQGFAERALNPIPIEVHTAIAEALPFYPVDITRHLWPAETDSGINRYPNTGALLRHLLMHVAGNMRAHAVRFSQLRDIAQLAARMSDAEWREFLDPASREALWWIYPPLSMSARYFPGQIPGDVVGIVQTHCPRWLRSASDRRTLTQVSWSNLRIDAFPGIEWARTPFEALRFAKTRIAPAKIALQELEHAQAVLPNLRKVPWYGQRHLTRILRWTFTRPPRVQTWTSVMAALEGESGPDQVALETPRPA